MIILGTNSIKDTGYDVANSARFNRADGAYMDRTFSSAGNRDKWTYSLWVKKCKNGVEQRLLTTSDNATFDDNIRFNSDDTLTVICNNSVVLKTNRVFRDNSAFYHICVIWDSGNGTSGDRCQLFVNGTRETSFSTASYPSQNQDSFINNNTRHYIGVTNVTANSHFLDGYLTEVVFQNDSADSPVDKFGSFDEDSGIWKPIDVSGLTFGTNGFYLDFEDSGALGNDAAGSNNFTVNNLTAIDQSTDTCTNNFATLNPLAYRLDAGVSLPTYSDGNTTVSYASDGGAGKSSMGTICFDQGKWYWEYKVNSANDTVFGGITRADYDPNDNFAGRSIYYNKTGALSVGTGTGGTADGSYGNSYTTNDIIGVAFDCDNGVIWFSKNGTWQNSATQSEIEAGTTTNSATTGITLNQFWSPFLEGANSGMSINFGSPAFAISSGNTDGNSYGNFEYAVPSGYYSLNTKNLSEYG